MGNFSQISHVAAFTVWERAESRASGPELLFLIAVLRGGIFRPYLSLVKSSKNSLRESIYQLFTRKKGLVFAKKPGFMGKRNYTKTVMIIAWR
jgi:hypothetical protein